MRKVVPLLLALGFALPAAAGAQEGVEPFLQKPPGPPDSGLSLAVRTGYGIPLGGLGNGVDLSQWLSGVVPFQIDVGWRFTPQLYAGAYFEYGIGILGSAAKAGYLCDQGVSCSGSQLRFGVDFVYTLLPRAKFVPWVGLGAGYEIVKTGGSAANQSVDETFKGWEFVHLQLGVDYRIWPAFRVGPFATFTFAQFSTVDTPIYVDPTTGTSTIGPSHSVDLQQKALHEWLQLGLKATYDF